MYFNENHSENDVYLLHQSSGSPIHSLLEDDKPFGRKQFVF